MKKLTVSLAMLLAVVIMAFSFTACGVSGRYEFESVTIAGTTYKEGDSIPLAGTINKDDFYIVLNKDGTCTVKVYNAQSEKSGTWTQDGKTIKFSISGISIGEATRDGRKLTLYFMIGTFTLKK